MFLGSQCCGNQFFSGKLVVAVRMLLMNSRIEARCILSACDALFLFDPNMLCFRSYYVLKC